MCSLDDDDDDGDLLGPEKARELTRTCTVSNAKSRAHHDTALEATERRVRFLVILWALGDLGSRLGAGFEFAFSRALSPVCLSSIHCSL